MQGSWCRYRVGLGLGRGTRLCSDYGCRVTTLVDSFRAGHLATPTSLSYSLLAAGCTHLGSHPHRPALDTGGVAPTY